MGVAEQVAAVFIPEELSHLVQEAFLGWLITGWQLINGHGTCFVPDFPGFFRGGNERLSC